MGLHKAIETPEIMWNLFEEYRTHIKGNPIKKHVFVGALGSSENERREKPLTYEGFCNYCEDRDIISTLDHYFINWEGRYTPFVAVCSRIKRVIRQDQIEGGMAGIYNPSITQRLNGLVDKTEVTEIKEQPLFNVDND